MYVTVIWVGGGEEDIPEIGSWWLIIGGVLYFTGQRAGQCESNRALVSHSVCSQRVSINVYSGFRTLKYKVGEGDCILGRGRIYLSVIIVEGD